MCLIKCPSRMHCLVRFPFNPYLFVHRFSPSSVVGEGGGAFMLMSYVWIYVISPVHPSG